MGKSIWGLIVFALAMACVEPFDIGHTSSSGLLVVEGILSDQFKRHQIFLSRATSLSERKIIRETGASVTISDQSGNVITLEESAPGVYETPELAAIATSVYVLHITTADGGEYQSKAVPFKSGAKLKDVYAEYVANPGETKGIQISLDTEDPSGNSIYYRWNYIETYEVHAPFPSNWYYVGNNRVAFRHEGIDTCYATDTLRSVMIKNTRNMEADKIVAEPIRFIPAYSHLLCYKYTILVQQFSLSEESYQYWQNVKNTSEAQGSLSDVQPGSVPGNITSINNPDEIVLGYFEACSVDEKRIKFTPIDFYDEGLIRPPEFRAYCFDIRPIEVFQLDLDAVWPLYEHNMYIWEVAGFEPFTAFLRPKVCCDCRDQGPTERPSYF